MVRRRFPVRAPGPVLAFSDVAQRTLCETEVRASQSEPICLSRARGRRVACLKVPLASQSGVCRRWLLRVHPQSLHTPPPQDGSAHESTNLLRTRSVRTSYWPNENSALSILVGVR